jgi:hypothetical protein
LTWLVTTPDVGFPNVKPVKNTAELQIHPAILEEAVILDESEIHFVLAVVADVGQRSADVTERKRRRLCEHAGVKPLAEPSVRITPRPLASPELVPIPTP